MDLRLILANIDWRLKVLDITDNEASNRAGAPDAIRNLRRKVSGELSGGITVKTLEKLAVALRCHAKDLMQPLPEENVNPIPGLRGQLMSQLAWLEQERDRVLRQIEALHAAEIPAEKTKKRKSR